MKRQRRKQRRRRDICQSYEPSSQIPYELQIEILTRLPAKSLMRFKSVSKLWSSLICSQYFSDRYLKISTRPLRIYMWNPNKALLSSSSSLDSDLSSIVIDQNLTIPAMECYPVSQVYHGLMCFVKGRSAKIYNTSTRQLVDLPDIEVLKLIPDEDLKWKSIMYNIGYDPVHNQYKVICRVSELGIDMTEIWFLLLGGHGSSRWRKTSNPHSPTMRLSLSINGHIYYVAVVHFSLSFVLVSIDIHSEEISIIQKPESSKWAYDLIELGGKVALLDYSDFEDEGLMKLWVLEDEEKHIWSKMKTLVLHSSQMSLVNDTCLYLKGTTRNGELIFEDQYTLVKPQSKTLVHVFIYSIQNNHLRKLKIKEKTSYESYRNKIWKVIGFDDVENLIYL